MSRKTVKTPCTCSQYSILAWNATNEDWDTKATTGCPGTLTGREFAPGHDAKLKGFLIRAGLASEEVSDSQGITASAEQMAKRFGFGHLVIAGIELGKEERAEKSMKRQLRARKADQRNDKANEQHDGNEARRAREAKSLAERVAAEEAKFAAEQAVSQPEPEWDDEPQIVKAKVGRWEYEGTVSDGEFTYEAKGEVRTTTKFTLV